MKTSRKVLIVFSALWLLVVITIAINEYSYSAGDFATSILDGALIPLCLIWGLVWIFSGKKKDVLQPPKNEVREIPPSITPKDEKRKIRSYTAVLVIGWIMAVLVSFAVFGTESRSNADMPLVSRIPFALGASILPFTAFVCGVSSWRVLWTFGPILLTAYSAVLVAVTLFKNLN